MTTTELVAVISERVIEISNEPRWAARAVYVTPRCASQIARGVLAVVRRQHEQLILEGYQPSGGTTNTEPPRGISSVRRD